MESEIARLFDEEEGREGDAGTTESQSRSRSQDSRASSWGGVSGVRGRVRVEMV